MYVTFNIQKMFKAVTRTLCPVGSSYSKICWIRSCRKASAFAETKCWNAGGGRRFMDLLMAAATADLSSLSGL